MDVRPTLVQLEAFASIAAHRSFRKAADERGLSPSTLSHMMQLLERQIGLRLLHRTSRSVALTQEGSALLDRIGPLMRDLGNALAEAGQAGAAPRGALRLNADEAAARVLLQTAVPTFLARFPGVALDVVTDGRFVDIVADGFDAGVRLGEAVPKDMIAVGFGGPGRFVAIASPGYLAQHGRPASPLHLRDHLCIRFRMPSGRRYRWEFARHGEEVVIDVPGPLTLDHPGLMTEAAAQGLGIAYVAERWAMPLIASGLLVSLFDAWCPAIPGLCLYYPGHRHVPAALRAFIDVVKAST